MKVLWFLLYSLIRPPLSNVMSHDTFFRVVIFLVGSHDPSAEPVIRVSKKHASHEKKVVSGPIYLFTTSFITLNVS